MHSPISNAGRGSCELPHNSLMILSNFANRGGVEARPSRVFRVAVALFALLTLAVAGDVFAVCVSAEVCGNGVDEDCDNAVDEGCGLLNTLVTVPYNFGTQGFKPATPVPGTAGQYGAELRTDPNYGLNYGPTMDYRWQLGMSSHAAACSINFAWFDTEANYDFLTLGSWSGTGTLQSVCVPPCGGPGVSSGYFSGSGTTLPTARFFTDQNDSTRPPPAVLGFRAQSQQCLYVAGTVTPNYYNIPVNTGIDGVLLHAKDDAYYSFVIPANREALVSLDHMGDTVQDFDLSSANGGIQPSMQACGSAGTACSSAVRGEFLEISGGANPRTVNLRVHAYSGLGRYRLFVSVPNSTYPCSGGTNVVDVGVESETSYTWEQLRIDAALTTMAVDLLAATDGQYIISKSFHIQNGIPYYIPFVAYEIVFNDDNNYTNQTIPCSPAARVPTMFGDYIEVNRWFWRGEATPCPITNATTTAVGEVLTHEWGHYAWQLNDQYDTGNPSKMRCTHSMMSGPLQLTYANGNVCYLEFCTSVDHNTSPQTGAGNPSTPATNDWGHIVSTCTNMATPSAGGTIVSSDFSQLSYMANGGMSFAMNWYY